MTTLLRLLALRPPAHHQDVFRRFAARLQSLIAGGGMSQS